MLHRAPAPPRGPAGFPELCARTPKPTPPPCAGKAPPVRPPGEHRAWPSWGLRVTQFPRCLAKGLGHCGYLARSAERGNRWTCLPCAAEGRRSAPDSPPGEDAAERVLRGHSVGTRSWTGVPAITLTLTQHPPKVPGTIMRILCFSSFTIHDNPVTVSNYYSHFVDEVDEAQRSLSSA